VVASGELELSVRPADYYRNTVVVVAHDTGPDLREIDGVFLSNGGDTKIDLRCTDGQNTRMAIAVSLGEAALGFHRSSSVLYHRAKYLSFSDCYIHGSR
jgi:hypothetical protein